MYVQDAKYYVIFFRKFGLKLRGGMRNCSACKRLGTMKMLLVSVRLTGIMLHNTFAQ